MRRIATIALTLLASAAAAQERPAELVRVADPAGLARFLGDPGGGAALVILLPDALGEDGRAEPYAEALRARGIASLVLGLGEDVDSPSTPIEPAAAPSAVAPALDWAREAGFAEGAIGVLGFGLGGRAALAAGQGVPVVALYPGCSGLPAGTAPAALIVQGDERAEGCDTLASSPHLQVDLLPGAGHAWDVPGAIWPSPGPLLPEPGGMGRLRARTDLAVTLSTAERVADWFEAQLLHGARSAGR
jgi:dienelactone hydrolase